MQDEPTTFGLNNEKLKKLLDLGQGIPDAWASLDENQKKTELFCDQLAESLPLDANVSRILPKVLSIVCEKLKPFTGCSIKDLLLDTETDLAIIETIKDIHKEQADAAAGKLEREIATAIYYAAIASALVFHNILITKFSYEDLQPLFIKLNKSPWLPPDFRNLFDKAHDLCVRRVKT